MIGCFIARLEVLGETALCSTDRISEAQALVQKLTDLELEFLRQLTAGESQARIACRLRLEDEIALAVRELLLRKLGAEAAADAVRIGIYAGL